MQDFEFIVEIDVDGNVTTTVNGVKGQKCSEVAGLLADLGQVTEDRHTPEWSEQEPINLDLDQGDELVVGGGLW
ncbi:MAG: hypothetical protein DRP52_02615 [Planctomycetota bacterium]|nr:MAG: hypothetical protein DRP52_02615 [Planctomycetota bacterium]